MSKAKRLIELMLTINTKKKFTVGELAREFQVSKRTILRDLQELSEAGMPLYSEVGVNGGYQVLKERTLPPITFTESEAVAMFFAYQSLQYYGSLPFEPESVSALLKFYNILPSDVKERVNVLKDRIVFWVPTMGTLTPHLSEMLQHAIEQHIVTINYTAENGLMTRRIIQPIGIYSMNGLWYCPAYCYKANAMRVFRVDRIRNAHKLRLRAPNKEVAKYKVQQFLGPFEDTVDNLPFVVKLTQHGVSRCESDYWLAQSLTAYPDGTGEIISTISPSFIAWAVDFFIGCGTDARVEQPEILVTKIKVRINELRSHY